MTVSKTHHLQVFSTAAALHTAAAELMMAIAHKAVAEYGRFTLALSGGQTPQQLYALLATPAFRKQLPWNKTFVFWGDERCVPLTDTRNNAHQATSILLSKVDIPLAHIHAISVSLPPVAAARRYEQELRHFFGAETPRFDLVLLGLGENGHTASLFPGAGVLDEQTARVRALYVTDEKMFRITMTAPLINQAHHLLFLVAGANKAEILEKVLNAPYHPKTYPAQLIQPTHGELHWLVDSAAARI